jgi:hypothetical protein
MSELLDLSIQAVKTAKTSFCRFITGNDAGTTGSHQAGFYIPKNAAPLLFGEKCHKGENREKWVTIKWQNDLETASRFIYYGQGTRNEYRITRFGKGFEFLQDRYVGSLIIIAEVDVDYYQAFVLESEDDIESFLSYFNLSTEQTNQIIDLSQARNEGDMLRLAIMERIKDLQDFPMTYEMGKMAQDIYNRLNNVGETYHLLQIDASLIYGLGDQYTGKLTEADLAFDSPYNLSKYPYLPPTPIGNPGLAAIEAALDPAETGYYFYARGQDNLHHFFRTYEEHLAFVNSSDYKG